MARRFVTKSVDQMLLDRILVGEVRPPKLGRVFYRVRHHPGLYLSVSHTGTGSWRLMYHFAGKQHKKVIGTLSAIPSVAEARREARDYLDGVRGGFDPHAIRLVSLNEIRGLPKPEDVGV